VLLQVSPCYTIDIRVKRKGRIARSTPPRTSQDNKPSPARAASGGGA